MPAVVPRPATGRVDTHAWRDGATVSYSLQVPYQGRRIRVPLGTNHQGWTPERADRERELVMAQIARGTWQPPTRQPQAPTLDELGETVRVTASRWWERRERELRPNTRADYRWRLDYVLAPQAGLATRPTGEVTVRHVDDFRSWLQAQGLAARSVNMILDVLAQILDDAVDYRLLDVNPARGRRRRLKVERSPRTFLEADMVIDLLDVAGEWEATLPEHQRYGRRALLACLCLAGLRVEELVAARRRDLDVHAGRLRVVDSKTAAGVRDVELTAVLLGELRAHLATVPARLCLDPTPDTPVFPSQRGGRLNAANIRNRLLHGTKGRPATKARKAERPIVGAVQRANALRGAQGRMLLPGRVTPHTLRRTFASLALAAGRDPRLVMGQIGHTDARLTLGVYAQVMQRQHVDSGLIWRLMRFPAEPDAQEANRTTKRTMHVSDTAGPSGRITW